MPSHLTLYGYYKSSCTQRLRIALNLKNIPYERIFIDFFGKEQRRPAYAAVNPSLTLPTLVVADHPGQPDPKTDLYITQSVAALEFLEDEVQLGDRSLRPERPADRARMRALVEIIAGDTQPRAANQTLEVLSEVLSDVKVSDKDTRLKWARDWHERGFRAYEALIDPVGPFSLGAQLTLADVVLVPAVWNARDKWGMTDLGEKFPKVQAVFDRMLEEKAVQEAYWRRQPDCPEGERI